MSKVNLIRNLMSGVWAIDANYAQAYYPTVFNILNNSAVVPEEKLLNLSYVNATNFQNNTQDLSSVEEKSVAVIPIKGAIIKYDTLCEYGTESVGKWIKSAQQNDNIAAIVLDIDSGGGAADAMPFISEIIKNSTKPIIAYTGNGMAASAAYGIASNATEIYASYKTDLVGSIGTYITIADFKAYYESQGLPILELYASDSTEKNRSYREALLGNTELLQKELDDFNKFFQNLIKTNRKGKLNLKDYPEVMMGKLFQTDDALKAGLIDGVKTFDEVIQRAFDLATNGNSKGTKSQTNQNQINMSKFAKLATLVGVASFESTDKGTYLSEEMLTSIEEALTAKETAESALATATTKATDLETKVSTLTTEATTSANKIAELETKVTELGKEHPGVKGAAVSTTAGEKTPGADGKKSDAELYPWLADLPNNPLFAKVTTEN